PALRPPALSLLSSYPFSCPGVHRHLHSFPTRRSSDLRILSLPAILKKVRINSSMINSERVSSSIFTFCAYSSTNKIFAKGKYGRSEEHTSELQSRFDLVCRLLLEKKKETMIRSSKLDL